MADAEWRVTDVRWNSDGQIVTLFERQGAKGLEQVFMPLCVKQAMKLVSRFAKRMQGRHVKIIK